MTNHRLQPCLAAARRPGKMVDELFRNVGGFLKRGRDEGVCEGMSLGKGKKVRWKAHGGYFRLLGPKQPHRSEEIAQASAPHQQAGSLNHQRTCRFYATSLQLYWSSSWAAFLHLCNVGGQKSKKFAVAMVALTDGRLAARQQCRSLDLSLCTKYADKCRIYCRYLQPSERATKTKVLWRRWWPHNPCNLRNTALKAGLEHVPRADKGAFAFNVTPC